MVNCLKCINSACCKLVVEVDKDEYNKFKSLELDNYFTTRTESFLEKNTKYKEHKEVFDEMYKDNFATLNKGNDGHCILLDRRTMRCMIYEDRPKVCKDYSFNSCKNIRMLKG